MTTQSPPLLQIRRLSRRAPLGGAWLLRDVSFCLHAGERLAIVGPSGSGKSLLLRAAAMLDPIEEGEILWRGETTPPRRIPEFRSRLIYLQQTPALAEGTVEENLRLPFELAVHRRRTYDRDRVVSWLGELGRDAHFLAKPAGELSGGERQICALLRAVQLDPEALLLDEPTAALDAAAAEAVERFVGSWRDAQPSRRAYIWVAHQREQVHRVADRTVALERGVRQ